MNVARMTDSDNREWLLFDFGEEVATLGGESEKEEDDVPEAGLSPRA